jgi:branched-chain amino acid transport system permease protein
MFRENKNWLIAFAVLLLVYPFMTKLEPYTLQIILLCGINVILATSLNLVNGFTGQFSMGHAGFMSVGAYTSATLTTVVFPSLFSSSSGSVLFIFPLLAGGLVACLMGFVVGLPSLRLRGDYLSIVTLGFGEIIRVLMQTTDYVGASRGLPGIPPIAGFGWIYGSMLVTLFVLWRIIQSLRKKFHCCSRR